MNEPFQLEATPLPKPARNLGLSAKQRAILAVLRDRKEITLDEAVTLVGRNIYHNAHKHVGVTLSNMVRRGLIVRVRPGVFTLPTDAP